MDIQGIKLMYFSPTGTTEGVLDGIVGGLAIPLLADHNLTLPASVTESVSCARQDLAILAAPVYAGRLPPLAVERLHQCHGTHTPAIIVVVYGNRAFDDALLELQDLATAQGFVPVAAAAFIGEHSFATEVLPIANGRPDKRDLDHAVAFGQQVNAKLAAVGSVDELSPLIVPGNYPYKPLNIAPHHAPDTASTCLQCGRCVDVCPTGAISMDNGIHTNQAQCILCCACIKTCPTHSRFWTDDKVPATAQRLHQNCQLRQAPDYFGI